MLKVVSTIKSGAIYVLSVILAFIAGFGVAYGVVMDALKERPRKRKKNIPYGNYYDKRDEEES